VGVGKVNQAIAVGSGFKEKEMAFLKHGSAIWGSQDVPNFVTSRHGVKPPFWGLGKVADLKYCILYSIPNRSA
jgi:hypothetical protein